MNTRTLASRFWDAKPLRDLNADEWEALCDGCARCCVHRFIDEDTGELFFTDVACRLLNHHTCRCDNYANRFERVPECIRLCPESILKIAGLPETCAYRRLAEGRELPSWHPLLTGDPDSTRRQGMSMCDRLVSEDDVEDIEARIIMNDDEEDVACTGCTAF
jgi:uncharacterized cysteine cluster protein YcgN (CxxCxxCC family)